MAPEVENKLEELRALCRSHPIRRLDLFGSAANETFHRDRSDFDFLVEFQDLPVGKRLEAYFDLWEAPQHLFEQPVDLVMHSAIDSLSMRRIFG